MIIGISGRKQAGKNTVANIFNGEFLKSKGLILDYKINDKGQLVIRTSDSSMNEGWGVLDVTRKDDEYASYAERNVWPYVKIYHFADYLKSIAVNLFGLPYEQVHGNDEDKNQQTDFSWSKMPSSKKRKGKLTIREFLQYFGTDLIRKIKDDAWVSATINLINNEGSSIALIPDVRFPNEVKAINEQGGFVIRLTRDIYSDDHKCESSLDPENFDWSNFEKVIDNSTSTIEHLQKEVQEIMRSIKC
mgnify:FL=1